MAIFSRKEKNDLAISLVSSAKQLQIGKRSEAERLRKLRSRNQWQGDIWTYYDEVPEVAYACNFLGWALSRLRLFVGRRDAPNEDPVEVTNNQLATDALNRLRAPGSGHSELMRMFGLNLSVPGECYLIGTHERGEVPETWRVRSIEELKLEGEKAKLIGGPDGMGTDIELDDDDYFCRIWIPHPNRLGDPDSPIRPLIDVCEDLLIASRASRAVMRSRLPAGLLLWPNSLTLQKVNSTADQSGGGSGDDADPTIATLIAAMATPVEDEGDVSALVPLLAKGKGEELQHVKHLLIERKLDPELEKKIDLARERLAQGLPVPAEVVTGMADVNHWTAWQISDDTFKAHVEPRAISVCDSLTAGYLQPYLETGGNPERAAPTASTEGETSELVIWFDAAALVVRPNRGEDAKDAHERIVISDKALRRELDFPETDAPDETERTRRENARRPPQRDEGPAAPGPPNDGDQPQEEDTGDDGEQSRQAAAPRVGERLVDLERRLMVIDRTFRDRILVAADAALQRVLEKAGARIRTRAQNNREITAALRGAQRPEDFASLLGPHLVASLSIEERDLIVGGFNELRQRFTRWCETFQRQALRAVPNMDDAERAEVEQLQAEDREDAARWLENAMEELALARLYDPRPNTPEDGEVDSSVGVPFGIIRETIARAGGAARAGNQRTAAISVGIPQRVLGMATGWLMRTILGRRGIETEGYEWEYGDYPRDRPFEPHEALDGLQFENFDDDQLANQESFPPVDFYMPGDHDGCVCDAVPILMQRAEAA